MNEIHTGDCFEVLAEIDADTFHACVTDPPYGLAFMGRDWDDFEPREYQAWCEEWASEVKRVLKPGGHLLAFSGNRTHHRLFSGIEDAGFEIRDTLTWHYGSGFPKSLDVSKAIDKAAGAERKVVGTYTNPRTGKPHEYPHDSDTKTCYAPDERDGQTARERTAPATPEAKQWDGFKTALKPATEFIVLARKPLGEDTVAANVLEYGTGALNIDGCRIGTDDNLDRPNSGQIGDGTKYSEAPEPDMDIVGHDEGRYPANVVFDETEAERLDREVGECKSGDYDGRDATGDSMFLDTDAEPRMDNGAYEDSDSGPSRYFYTSKASRAERTLNGKIENAHPTVKPVDLMEWLVKLVTAEGQIVLDPFAGTGTTCLAAKNLNRRFIGIERQAKWADVARARCSLDVRDPSRLREETQGGLEVYGGDAGDE